jgi:hypothetical protein
MEGEKGHDFQPQLHASDEEVDAENEAVVIMSAVEPSDTRNVEVNGDRDTTSFAGSCGGYVRR